MRLGNEIDEKASCAFFVGDELRVVESGRSSEEGRGQRAETPVRGVWR